MSSNSPGAPKTEMSSTESPEQEEQKQEVEDGAEMEPKRKSIKSKFTAEEDEKLKMLVLSHGTGSWAYIARLMGTRNHRQCRERWKNYINPALRNDPWTLEEDQLLVDKYAEFGPRWNRIARCFVNRSDNAIRNRWQLMLRQWERQKEGQICMNFDGDGSCTHPPGPAPAPQ